MYLIRDVVLLLLSISLAQSRSTKRAFVNETSEIFNNMDSDYYSVSAIIERANKDTGKIEGDFIITQGDIAVYTGLRNADPCTAIGCKWHRSNNGHVYVPYVISEQFSTSERNVIQHGLDSFAKSTCIRFIPRIIQTDYINIISEQGCYSFMGRISGKQDLSLQRSGCIYHKTVQHELLHALGFNHEHSRSDRDLHVKILYENIEPDKKNNFDKVATNNLNTPYDYNSVMQYSSHAFSKNDQPTIVPIPDCTVPIGRATEMSFNDILRVNRLYCT